MKLIYVQSAACELCSMLLREVEHAIGELTGLDLVIMTFDYDGRRDAAAYAVEAVQQQFPAELFNVLEMLQTETNLKGEVLNKEEVVERCANHLSVEPGQFQRLMYSTAVIESLDDNLDFINNTGVTTTPALLLMNGYEGWIVNHAGLIRSSEIVRRVQAVREQQSQN